MKGDYDKNQKFEVTVLALVSANGQIYPVFH